MELIQYIAICAFATLSIWGFVTHRFYKWKEEDIKFSLRLIEQCFHDQNNAIKETMDQFHRSINRIQSKVLAEVLPMRSHMDEVEKELNKLREDINRLSQNPNNDNK